MNYKEHAKTNFLPTRIKTYITEKLEMSSVYRKYDVMGTEKTGWETILINDGTVIYDFEPLAKADDVINLHCHILKKYIDNNWLIG